MKRLTRWSVECDENALLQAPRQVTLNLSWVYVVGIDNLSCFYPLKEALSTHHARVLYCKYS